MKYTPGPWHIGREQDHSADRWKRNAEWSKIRGMDNGLIASIESVHPKGKRHSADFDIEAANARLISAAPDLLDAAIDIIRVIEAGISTQSIYDTKGGTLDAIRDAVKKARGDL